MKITNIVQKGTNALLTGVFVVGMGLSAQAQEDNTRHIMVVKSCNEITDVYKLDYGTNYTFDEQTNTWRIPNYLGRDVVIPNNDVKIISLTKNQPGAYSYWNLFCDYHKDMMLDASYKDVCSSAKEILYKNAVNKSTKN